MAGSTLVAEVIASEQRWLKRRGGMYGHMCSTASRVLWNPDSQINFLGYFCRIFKSPSFGFVLWGSFSTLEPPVIMQFNFYPWTFDFTFHHHQALIKPQHIHLIVFTTLFPQGKVRLYDNITLLKTKLLVMLLTVISFIHQLIKFSCQFASIQKKINGRHGLAQVTGIKNGLGHLCSQN